MSASIMAGHSFEAVKVIVSPSECADAAEKLVPVLQEAWEFEYWLVEGFNYRYETPDFDGDAPDGVDVLALDRSGNIWTNRSGLAVLAPFVRADWTDIVGSHSCGDKRGLLSELAGSEFVMLSCIDSAHWLCVSSDPDRLLSFAAKLPYVYEKIVIDLERRSDWGL